MAIPYVALITAGSAGLGAATARVFAAAGIRVVINYNYSSNAERANEVVKELQTLSPLINSEINFLSIKADLGKRVEIMRLVEEDFNNLDDNVNEDDWDRCYNVNVKSHLFLMYATRDHLDATEGSFITTASTAGVRPSGSSLAYSVTKAAQIHLVKGLATIAAPKIRVNADAALAATKLKRHITVEDVADQVMYFAKSRSTTGFNAVVDGGITL
ncbi:MAG: hypothetical protein M1818_007668 [Claussenomyces sp. TS43310]|nr:MAG: hypothetical protein M1818_007668 [Claussenomyces sp. TS43310]